MIDAGVTPDEKSGGEIKRGAGRQWKKALLIFREMAGVGISPGILIFRDHVTACGKGEQW